MVCFLSLPSTRIISMVGTTSQPRPPVSTPRNTKTNPNSQIDPDTLLNDIFRPGVQRRKKLFYEQDKGSICSYDGLGRLSRPPIDR